MIRAITASSLLLATLGSSLQAEEPRTHPGPAPSLFQQHETAIKVQAGIRALSLRNDDVLEDSGQETELQLQAWPMKEVGFAIIIAHSNWDLDLARDARDKEFGSDEQSFSSSPKTTVFDSEGELDLYTIGAEIRGAYPVTSFLCISPTIGVRYIIIDPDATATEKESFKTGPQSDGDLSTIATKKYEADNALAGTIGIDLVLKITKLLQLAAGVGYQFDLIPGEIDASFSSAKGSTHEVELDAYFGHAAVILTF